MNRSGIPTLNAGAYDNLPGSSLRLSGDQRPTYTQRRRTQMAGGGIMGSNAGSMLVAPTADGSRPGYAWYDDLWEGAKKIGQTIIPGGETGYIDLYGDTPSLPTGDPTGQGDYDIYGNKIPETGDDRNIFEKGWDVAKKVGQTLIPGGETGYFDLYGEDDPDTTTNGNGKYPIKWKTPMAIGAAAGFAQSKMPKAKLPTDTSGIDIANIRSRALTGSDPNLHFLPPPEATTAYAQGGRIGYQYGYGVGLPPRRGGKLRARDFKKLVEAMQRRSERLQAQREKQRLLGEERELRPTGLGAAQGGRIGAQEGGLMNLGGMEKDYRQEGGFVPIGGQERADDVPARLSKNEFVFTADAVRAAGGGDIDAGAEVMENVMNNLEQGGQISEESQGLEGARNMFATAQRLEGVM